MSWNKHTSQQRIEQHVEQMRSRQIRINPLKRPMNLSIVLSEYQCRRILGAHVYATIPAFADASALLSEPGRSQEAKQLLQAMHLYQREVFRLVEQVFHGYQVHFQGPKLHAVLCSPYGQDGPLALRAILLQLVLGELVHNVLPQVFPVCQSMTLASGTDIGQTIATRNGKKQHRELLFLGTPANYAAKIINQKDAFPHLTEEILQKLPKELREHCTRVKAPTSVDTPVYHLAPLEKGYVQRLLQRYDISWKAEESKRILVQFKREIALKEITCTSTRRLIDVYELSIKNNHQVFAASLFADVSGYTAFIEKAEQTHTTTEALQVLHVIRREMSRVIVNDYEGVHIQFQGDRVQGLFHRPTGDAQAIAQQAVEAAIGLQSSIEGPLKACLPAAKELHLAVGIDMGQTLLSRLGVRRQRDAICLGQAVERAAELEEACEAGEIGIAPGVYTQLPAPLSRSFQYDQRKHCHISMR